MKPRRNKRNPWLERAETVGIELWNRVKTIRPLWIAVGMLAAPLVLFACFSLRKSVPRSESQEIYFTLHHVAGRGLFEFLPARERLRHTVARELASQPAAAIASQAREIAVFMFPELLSEDDFEKKQAYELWVPLIRAMEDTGNRVPYVSSLEELRALLWQYQNPDRQEPRISPAAGQMIRIYENLAAAEGPKR